MQQRHWKTAERGKRRKAGYSASPDLGHVVNNHMTVIWNRWSAIRTIKISSKNLERRILARLSSFHLYQKRMGGQCVGCFEDTPIMKASIKDGDLALKVLDDTASDPAPYGFAIFNADNQELLDAFNAGLADIKANGKYDEILAKYLG